jgi:hypothetical protein
MYKVDKAAKAKGMAELAKKRGALVGAGGKGIRQMKTGGMVKETALHLLHKGEMVLPANVTQHIHKLIKKAKDIKNIVKS